MLLKTVNTQLESELKDAEDIVNTQLLESLTNDAEDIVDVEKIKEELNCINQEYINVVYKIKRRISETL